MSISDKERAIFVSIIAAACSAKIALIECTEKETGKRVLALAVPNPEKTEDAAVYALVSAENLEQTIEPTKGGETLGIIAPPILMPAQPSFEPSFGCSNRKPIVN